MLFGLGDLRGGHRASSSTDADPDADPDRAAAPSPGVHISISNLTPKLGNTFVVTTWLDDCHGNELTDIELEGDRLQLFRLVPGLTKEDAEGNENLAVMSDGVYRKLATQLVDENCRTAFAVKANFETATFKSVWSRQDPRYRRGHSKASVIVTR